MNIVKAFVKYKDHDTGEVMYTSLSDVIITEEGGVVGSNYLDAFDIPPEDVIEVAMF